MHAERERARTYRGGARVLLGVQEVQLDGNQSFQETVHAQEGGRGVNQVQVVNIPGSTSH